MVLKFGKFTVAVLHKNDHTLLTKKDASMLNYTYGSLKAKGEDAGTPVMKRLRNLVDTFL